MDACGVDVGVVAAGLSADETDALLDRGGRPPRPPPRRARRRPPRPARCASAPACVPWPRTRRWPSCGSRRSCTSTRSTTSSTTRVYATCAELGLPVSVNVGIPGPRVRSACQHPELPRGRPHRLQGADRDRRPHGPPLRSAADAVHAQVAGPLPVELGLPRQVHGPGAGRVHGLLARHGAASSTRPTTPSCPWSGRWPPPGTCPSPTRRPRPSWAARRPGSSASAEPRRDGRRRRRWSHRYGAGMDLGPSRRVVERLLAGGGRAGPRRGARARVPRLRGPVVVGTLRPRALAALRTPPGVDGPRRRWPAASSASGPVPPRTWALPSPRSRSASGAASCSASAPATPRSSSTTPAPTRTWSPTSMRSMP